MDSSREGVLTGRAGAVVLPTPDGRRARTGWLSGRAVAARLPFTGGISEVDERRIDELTKTPPRVLRDGTSAKALKEARKVLKVQALICRQKSGINPRDGGHA